MKVPRHTHPNEEQPWPIKSKPVFKVTPVLSQRTLSLLSSSPSTCRRLPPSTISTKNSASSLVSSNIRSIANTMKLRMKAAVKTMVWNNKNRALLSSLVLPARTTGVKPSFYHQQQQHNQKPMALFPATMPSHTLLKQYLSFVQEETGTLVDMEASLSNPATDSLPMPSLEYQPHPLASSGATLIESLVYDPMSKMTELYKQNDVNQKRPPSRSASTSEIASKIENDQLNVDMNQQIKKSERLRLKQQRQQQEQQRRPSPNTDSLSTFINDNELETVTPIETTTAAATGIRCICDKPYEEFGSMVQCDDCSYWLHLNCLALDEESLDDTYRCPTCYVNLGPGQCTASRTVTWRLAAQLKSKKLASRKSRDRGIHKRNLGHKHKKSTLKRRLVQLEQKQQRQHRYQSTYSVYDDDEYDILSYSSSSDSNTEVDLDYKQQQSWMIPKMTIDPLIETTMTTPTGNVLVQKLNTKLATNLQQNNDDMDIENLFDSDTTESDCEFGGTHQRHRLQQQQQQQQQYCRLDNDHRNSIASSSSSSSSIATVPSLVSSPSHASSDMDSTSDEHCANDDFCAMGTTKSNSSILSTTATSACLDQESLLWLSRLAYLESLQSSSKQQCFTPHASDVFLCDDQHQQQHQQQQTDPFVAETPTMNDDHQYHTPIMTSSARSDPPSAICSHDLSQFSFDTGPFWSPTHHQATDSCLFF